MGRTKIASFQRKSYKNLQLNARKIPNLSNEIIDFGIVQAELGNGSGGHNTHRPNLLNF
jgi:hypothetical protein